jgi:hypothetical protein
VSESTTTIVPTGTLLDAVAEKLSDLTLDLRPLTWGGPGGAQLTIGNPNEWGTTVELILSPNSGRPYGPKIVAVTLKAYKVHKRWTKLDAEKIATEARRVHAERITAVADGNARSKERIARGRRETAASAWVRTAVEAINAPLKGMGTRVFDHNWAVTEREDVTGARSYHYKLELSYLSEDEMRAILAVLTPPATP